MVSRVIIGAAVLLLLSSEVLAQPRRSAPPPPGNRIHASDGDIVVVENDARVTIVRRREANVRVVFNSAENWLVLLGDYATANGGPDGRVDVKYSYTGLSGEWPMEARWEGPTTIEDYTIAGEGGPSRMGFTGPRGLVQILGPSQMEMFRDPAAAAVLSFRGSGRGIASGLSFDEAERREIEQTRRNAERLPPHVRSSTSLTLTPGGATTSAASGTPQLRVGGNISAPAKIADARPIVPEAAVRAGVSGVVILEITIDTDGLVKEARVLRSIPLLDRAALDAVRQWRYTPTLLNGQPVQVIMTVTVPFP